MTPEILTLLMFVGILIGVFLGFPIGFTLGGLGLLFGFIGFGPKMFNILGNTVYGVMGNYTLAAIPLFVFMGCMLDSSGMATRAFDVMAEWLRTLRGGVALATLVICTLFAACTGIVGASVTTMGLLALTPMLDRGYDKSLATGVVASGGTLGILIPPSIMLVMFGPIAGLSVVDLFAAAFTPGIMLAVLYMIYVIIAPRIKQDLIPKPDKAIIRSMPRKYSLGQGLLTFIPFIALIFMVLGAIFFGFASPTEAAGLGALGSIILSICVKSCGFKQLTDAGIMTLKTSSMVMFVAVGANVFTSMFFAAGGSRVVTQTIQNMHLGPWGSLAMVLVLVFILGMLIDWVGILLIVTPIFLPVLVDFGFDALWVGMLIIVIMQSSFLTPPFAVSLFYIKGVSPPEVTTADIYRGAVPFILIQCVGLLLCIAFPDIILWLPRFLAAS
jgi:tripartite ATP-independent transporter DctM subunit